VPNYLSERFSERANKPTNSARNPLATKNGAAMIKAESYSEIFLWNQCVDRMVRVLDTLELHAIRPRQDLKAYAIRLEEIRAGLNADFTEVTIARERADEYRFWCWRTAWKNRRNWPTELLPLAAAQPFPRRNKTTPTSHTPCGFRGPTR
jgi:hypothetical protein